ncbi:MAG TPA: GH92 family glycosyl hydrolase [Kofleriaceae bacterium]|nr:GH92 family glycosyl hydrolase [Kofleriaceae bacterium]
MRIAAAFAVTLLACGQNAPLSEVTDPIPLVDPLIGAGGLGFTYGGVFVGAAVPHGLVKVGPDTNGPYGTVGFLHFSGYWDGDDRVQGFSHLHLHGAGVPDLGNLSLMPVPGAMFDAQKTSVRDYEAHFEKSDEVAGAAEYRVKLATGVDVSLAATAHAADHVYDFGGAQGDVVIDLMKTLEGGTVTDPMITVDDAAHELSGRFHAKGGMSGNYGGFDLFFVIRAKDAWTSSMTWTGGAVLKFPAGAPVELHVGVSLVSIAGARANLDAEMPSFDHALVIANAESAWRELLARVKITGGTDAERRIFYTSLYHAFLMPTIISDVDGSYQLAGMTSPAHATFRMMSDLSLWDTYRTVASLYAWLAPEDARDVGRSLAAFGAGTGAFPRWPVLIGEGGSMLGASAEIAIADAELRVGDAGGADAWPLLRAEAIDTTPPAGGRGERAGVDAYMPNGWAPSTTGRSASLTTEFAHDDVALAGLAEKLGHTADADLLRTRSHGWRNLYDPAVGFVRARHADGSFPASFDDLAQSDDYAEANAWQSLWMAGAHDPDGLVMLLGGQDAFVAKLTTFFTMAKADYEASPDSMLPRPYYWHGNEPDLNAAWLFAQTGRRDLTVQWVSWILDTQYTDRPAGLQGNDDGGTMGAWYVLAACGVYPVPGTDRWIVGAPRFPKIRVDVGGHELVIEQSSELTVDGAPIDGPYLTHAQLAGASSLHFD